MSQTAANASVPVTALEDCIECPVCMEVPTSPPIFQCERGHILCKTCHSKLSNCPSCSGALRSTRCLVAEKLLEKVPVMCNFAKNGCSER